MSDTMLADWLRCAARDPSEYASFKLVDGMEHTAPGPALHDRLAEMLRNARFNPAFLQEVASYLGWRSVADAVQTSTPIQTNGRRGVFGEALVCDLLEEFEGYLVPVKKFQFAITRGQSLPGTDALALKLSADGEISEACFVESKLRTGSSTLAAVEGYAQLKADHSKSIPDILMFVAARLWERGDPLAPVLMRYMRSRSQTPDVDTFRLGLVWEESAWTETVLRNLEDASVDVALGVHAVRVSGLGALTESVFAAIGITGLVDDA